MLNKALQTNSEQIPDKVIDLLIGKPTVKEMAQKLAKMIHETRYEFTDSFEFIFDKGKYSFCCDVRTREHGQEIECSCPMTFFEGDEIETEPGILYELEYETKQLI
jgi:hypothetical protein